MDEKMQTAALKQELATAKHELAEARAYIRRRILAEADPALKESLARKIKACDEIMEERDQALKERDEARAEVERLTDERDELLVRLADQGAELRATREAYNGARTDVPALIARVRELEAECERMKTFAAQNFSAMIRQEAEQMREYGLSYEGVRQVLHEYTDGEISFGKLMDLIRAAARAMAEDIKNEWLLHHDTKHQRDEG